MNKAMSIVGMILSVILFLFSLLLLLATPFGLVGMAVAGLFFYLAFRSWKQIKNASAPTAAASRPVSSSAPVSRAASVPAAADLDKISTRPFEAVGMRFRMDSVRQVLERNPEYRNPDDTTRMYYMYAPFIRPCTLEPEDDNQYDHNAVMILVDGIHVGYIAAGSALRARDALSVGCTFDLNLFGGTYKSYDEEKAEWVTHRGDLMGKVTVHKPLKKDL